MAVFLFHSFYIASVASIYVLYILRQLPIVQEAKKSKAIYYFNYIKGSPGNFLSNPYVHPIPLEGGKRKHHLNRS
jgi:hypothetical protein